jgi:hypothetical protein
VLNLPTDKSGLTNKYKNDEMKHIANCNKDVLKLKVEFDNILVHGQTVKCPKPSCDK